MVMFSYEYGVDIDECYGGSADCPGYGQPSASGGCVHTCGYRIEYVPISGYDSECPGGRGIGSEKTLEDTLIPDMESITDVAQVDVSGGTQDYIRVLLREDMLKQYGLNMAAVANYLGAVDFTIPAGSVKQGNQDISVSAAMEFNTVQRLEQVPVITASGSVVHLSDIAEVSMAKEKPDTISKSDGRETISISIQKKQSASVVQVTQKIIKLIDSYMEKNPGIDISIEYNSSDIITSSLWSVGKTLIAGVLISMAVLFIFFGDFKASLIVGSSMPVSILATLILMSMMGYSMNIVTMGSLVIAIGMIVDNSIVVIESCFRWKDSEESYWDAAFNGDENGNHGQS